MNLANETPVSLVMVINVITSNWFLVLVS